VSRVDIEQFRASGWTGPVDLLTEKETQLLSSYLQSDEPAAPSVWSKGLAVTNRIIYELASDSRIKSILEELLGQNYFLWGASVVERAPNEAHPWHTDIETAASDGKAVSLWLGLRHSSPKSALCFVSGSHLLGKSLQEAAAAGGLSRECRTSESSFKLADALADGCSLVQPLVSDGQALLFDGRIWHGSLNEQSKGARLALVLQYASSEVAIRIPDWSQLDWPFRFKASPKPPVIPIAGKSVGREHRVVAPPPERPPDIRPLKNLVCSISLPLERNPAGGWRPTHLFLGSTPVLRKLSCHASVLEPGKSPHAPHSHLDEEILTILDGEAEIVIAESQDDANPRRERMSRGDLVYYPSGQFHTIQCVGDRPVSYFMYRWNAALHADEEALGVNIVRAKDMRNFDGVRLFDTSLLFEGPTDLLQKLHVHASRVVEGGGYKKHRDQHDVAILLLEGSVRTLGRVVDAPAVLFHPARALHGLAGTGSRPASYLVVEFHGPYNHPPPPALVAGWRLRRFAARLKRAAFRRVKVLRGLRRSNRRLD
jgi:mannose-6-phosphate isomerase-like protein (cupin superfamily)